MLRVSRLTDYATVVMTCIAAHPTTVLSTGQIAEQTRLELPTVSKLLKALSHASLVESFRGVNGGYWLTKNAGLAYPAQTADPGVAQAHLFFQIQNGVQHIIQPAPYIEASYTNPSWI